MKSHSALRIKTNKAKHLTPINCYVLVYYTTMMMIIHQLCETRVPI